MKEIIGKAVAIYLGVTGIFTLIAFVATLFSEGIEFINAVVVAIHYSIYILVPIALIGGGLVLYAYSDDVFKEDKKYE